MAQTLYTGSFSCRSQKECRVRIRHIGTHTMNYNNQISYKTAGVIRYSCALLFLAFCFCYLYFIEGEQLAAVQHIYSHGMTHYDSLTGAFIIPIILLVIQWLTAFICKLPSPLYAMSYAPSFIALTLLCHLCENRTGTFVFGNWTWVVPLLLIMFVVSVIISRCFFETSNPSNINSHAWKNYAILLIFVITMGLISATKDTVIYELKTERLISEKKFSDASKVAYSSLATSPRLNQLRAYAYTHEGQLTEHLFDYPQRFQGRGLIDINDTSWCYRIDARNIEAFLGSISGSNIRNTRRYLELINANDSTRNNRTKDYFLCYLLLEQDVETFTKKVADYYTLTPDSLPTLYQTALLVHEAPTDSAAIFAVPYACDSVKQEYLAYLDMSVQYADPVERRNRLRREYSHTYIWYHDYWMFLSEEE